MKSPIKPSIAALCFAGAFSLMPAVALADATQILKDRQEKILQVVGASSKAVVGMNGIGSGVIVSKDGLILTAGHVMDALAGLRKNSEGEFNVTLADGKTVKAKPLGRNRNRDAALAQITTKGEYPFAEMADPAGIKEGDWVVAMGHPGGYQVDRTAPVRVGRLWKKDDKSYFRSDCTVSGGDSGGPLFNLEGKVIGIHSSIGQGLEENRHVPIGAFKESWERMAKGDVWGQLGKLMPELAPFDRGHGPRKAGEKDAPPQNPAPRLEKDAPQEAPAGARPFLGIRMSPVDDGGVEVTEVSASSPAAEAGLSPKDLITKVDGKSVESVDAMAELVGARKPGDKLKLSVNRGNEQKEIEVTLGKR